MAKKIEKTTYQSEDGKEFATQAEAEAHDKQEKEEKDKLTRRNFVDASSLCMISLPAHMLEMVGFNSLKTLSLNEDKVVKDVIVEGMQEATYNFGYIEAIVKQTRQLIKDYGGGKGNYYLKLGIKQNEPLKVEITITDAKSENPATVRFYLAPYLEE